MSLEGVGVVLRGSHGGHVGKTGQTHGEDTLSSTPAPISAAHTPAALQTNCTNNPSPLHLLHTLGLDSSRCVSSFKNKRGINYHQPSPSPPPSPKDSNSSCRQTRLPWVQNYSSNSRLSSGRTFGKSPHSETIKVLQDNMCC